MKKIMVLGAGIYQVPLIKKIKDMGYQVLVVSPLGAYPGIGIADVFIESDTRDKERVLSAAKKYNIDAILTTGTDVAVPTIGYVIDELKLIGTGLLAATKSMDKALMKKCFVEHGVNTARFEIVESFEQLVEIARVIGYPVMVKATDSSGSRGITKVLRESELLSAYNSALDVTKSDKIIIEEFLEGIEIGAQAVVIKNDVVEVFLHDDEITTPPISVPIGHAMPLRLDSVILNDIQLLVKAAVKAIGIENTISNIDIIIVDNKPYVIEIAARMGATCLAENISIYTGYNIYEFIIELALGNNITLPNEYTEQANAAMLLLSEKTGVVKNISVPDTTKNHIDLVNLSIDVKIGSKVNKFKVGPDRIGEIIVIGKNAKEAITLAKKLANTIRIEIDE
jgi:biotin carboxylase